MSSYDELKELEERNRENRKRIVSGLLARIPLFTGILIALWWVFYGTLEIEWSVKTIFGNVILTIATIVFAVTYCNLIADGGFRTAENTDDYKNSKKEYKNVIKQGIKYKDEITDYAMKIAKSNLKELRKRNLEANYLKYEDYFNEDGTMKNLNLKDKKLTLHQKKIIKRCIRAHIILPNLFIGVNGEGYFGIRREKSKKEYLTGQQITKIITRTILSFVSLGLALKYIGFNINGIMYAFFQITLWTASGVSQRVSNYRFVLETQLPQLESKTLVIKGYLASKGYLINDEEEEKTDGRIRQELKSEEETN